MNDEIRRRLTSGQRCKQWIADFTELIPADTIFRTRCNQFAEVVDELNELVGNVTAAVSESLWATDVKGSVRENLIATLEKIRFAAKAAEPDHSGTQDRYRYRRNMSHQELLAAARSFQSGGVDDDQLLQDYGAPKHWVETVTNMANAFEGAFAQQASAQGTQVSKNAQIIEKTDLMQQLKRTIGFMVKNYCADNVGALAAWASAAHVEEAPRKKKTDPAQPILKPKTVVSTANAEPPVADTGESVS